MQRVQDLTMARQWVLQNCPHARMREILLRGLEWEEVFARVGLEVEAIDAQCLWEFLTDEQNRAAVLAHFPQPEL